MFRHQPWLVSCDWFWPCTWTVLLAHTPRVKSSVLHRTAPTSEASHKFGVPQATRTLTD